MKPLAILILILACCQPPVWAEQETDTDITILDTIIVTESGSKTEVAQHQRGHHRDHGKRY